MKKVQAAIQADQVRVSSASKDELQEAMRVLREHDFGVRAPVRQLPRLMAHAAFAALSLALASAAPGCRRSAGAARVLAAGARRRHNAARQRGRGAERRIPESASRPTSRSTRSSKPRCRPAREGDPGEVDEHQTALAQLIVQARAQAKQGDIFPQPMRAVLPPPDCSARCRRPGGPGHQAVAHRGEPGQGAAARSTAATPTRSADDDAAADSGGAAEAARGARVPLHRQAARSCSTSTRTSSSTTSTRRCRSGSPPADARHRDSSQRSPSSFAWRPRCACRARRGARRRRDPACSRPHRQRSRPPRRCR